MADETVEISKDRLEALGRAEALLNGLWNDKEKGLAFKKMVKEKVPTASIPELDMIDTVTKPYNDKISALEESQKKLQANLEKWETEKLNAKEEGEMTKMLDDIRKRHGFTDSGMQKVIDRMKEKNNPDADSAAAWVLSQEPKAKPAASSVVPGLPGKMNLYGSAKNDEMWAELNKDPQGFADQEIANIITNPSDYLEFGGQL